MRMAIVHDGFLHVGGAEKVLLDLIDIYPQADLFIPIINQSLIELLKAKSKGKIHTTIFSYIPYFYEKASFLKPILIFYWENLNLSKYNFVITSSHSFNSKLINVSKSAKHLSYIYTPPRYLSNNFNEISFIKDPKLNWLIKPLLNWLKKKDYESGKKPNLMIAISETVRERIKKAYGRSSLVIYPPVETKKAIDTSKNQGYYLCFSRLVKQKGIDLAVRSFNHLGLPLVIVGTGPELDKLKKIANPNIKFLGFLSEDQLDSVFSQAKALVNCAIEEDFGMVTVEAATRGIPTIAYYSGGLKETVLNNKTGVFFTEHNVESLCNAIIKFKKAKISPQDCHNFAQKFSKQIFKKKIKIAVNYLIDHE